MKIEFKQSFECEGKEFKVTRKDKPGTAEVPGYFIFLLTFEELFKASLITILEVSEKDFEDVPKMYADMKPCEEILGVLEAFQKAHEETQLGEDSEKPSTAGDSVDSSIQSESSQASEEVKAGGEEVSAPSVEVEEDLNEYAALQEKIKRLSKKERERFEELKAKLKIEE